MSESTLRCPLCGGDIEGGYLRDRGHSDRGRVLEWIEGQPESSFWTGTVTAGRAKCEVEALRCVQCGYILLFAGRAASAG